MEKVNYLPLGSIVVVKGGVKKFMIVARGLGVKIGDKSSYFDYGACMYPEGMMGDKMMYFQHEDIVKIIFSGFSDEDNELMVENINAELAVTQLERADVKELQKEMTKENG
jgi:hypothetical protein